MIKTMTLTSLLCIFSNQANAGWFSNLLNRWKQPLAVSKTLQDSPTCNCVGMGVCGNPKKCYCSDHTTTEVPDPSTCPGPLPTKGGGGVVPSPSPSPSFACVMVGCVQMRTFWDNQLRLYDSANPNAHGAGPYTGSCRNFCDMSPVGYTPNHCYLVPQSVYGQNDPYNFLLTYFRANGCNQGPPGSQNQ